MSERKPYSSSLRDAQARATRRAIVDAAARLFVADGYGATTVDAIAAEAGVSRKTVFASVGGKVEALKLAIDWAVVGDDEPVALLDRPRLARMRAEPDVHKVIAAYAALVCEVGGRMSRLVAVAEAAAGLEPEIADLVAGLQSARHRGMTVFAEDLLARGVVRAGLTKAQLADVLWFYNDPLAYHRLVNQRGWPVARYRRWLRETLADAVLEPGLSRAAGASAARAGRRAAPGPR